MRAIIRSQLPLCLLSMAGDHPHAKELQRIADLLDKLPHLSALVYKDLVREGIRTDVGREGLSAEQTLRILMLYLMLQIDFDELAFHLADSPTYRRFCLIGIASRPPKRAALHKNLSCLSPETLEATHQVLVQYAVQNGLESGEKVRTDTTPVAAPIREPSDSLLLGDSVRVLDRLLRRAQHTVPMSIPAHKKRVRRRVVALLTAKEEDRAALYQDLLCDTQEYADAALFAATWLEGYPPTPANLSLGIDLRCRAETALRIIEQTERRVFAQQSVPSQEKTVSLFHPEVDILCKRKKVVYGHKLCLSFGQSGLVLAATVLQGNPADATLTVPSIKTVKRNTGKTPKQTAMDGGFASRQNLKDLKEMGVEKVGFSKGRGMSAEELCGDKRQHRKLRRYRAGVEGLISWLKRTVQLGRVRWKGEAGFRSYVWGAILTASLRAVANAGAT